MFNIRSFSKNKNDLSKRNKMIDEIFTRSLSRSKHDVEKKLLEESHNFDEGL